MPPLGNARRPFFGEILTSSRCSSSFRHRDGVPDPVGNDLFRGRRLGEREGGKTGFLLVEMLVFMFILAVGYVYVWKRGRSSGIEREGLRS